MKYSLALLIALTGCARGAVVVDRPAPVSIPVSQPCVAGERPAPVASMKSQHPDWYGLTPKQKAEIASAQALRYRSYGDALNAVTSACG
jgi:hypothetical protein